MRTWLFGLLAALATLLPNGEARAQAVVTICVQAQPGPSCTPVTVANPFPVLASATISGFTAATTGTPISVTTSNSTGTLPAGAVVVATNVGTTNGAYCALGAAATTASQYLSPNGGWFAFTVGASTQLTCVTSTSTTTVNMTGGAGLPTGTGGGGGSGGGSVTQGTSPWIVAGGGTAGTAATGVVTVQGIASMTPLLTSSSGGALMLDATGQSILTAVNSPIPAGTAIIGKIGIDQSTPGTTNLVALSAETTKVIGTVNQGTSPWVVSGAVTIAANSAVNVAQINGVTPLMGNGVTGTGSQRVTIASDNTAFSVNATLSAETTKVIGTVNQGTSPWATNVSQINGVTPLMGAGNTGTGSPRVTVATDQAAIATAGQGATGATAPTGATLAGCVAQNAEATALTNGQMGGVACDLTKKQIVIPFANPENWVQGTTSAMTGTTSTSLIASAGGSLRNYAWVSCVNSHATVGTFVTIQDGSGGTALATVAAAANYGGQIDATPIPIKSTAATGIFVANVTTGANVICSARGYKGL